MHRSCSTIVPYYTVEQERWTEGNVRYCCVNIWHLDSEDGKGLKFSYGAARLWARVARIGNLLDESALGFTLAVHTLALLLRWWAVKYCTGLIANNDQIGCENYWLTHTVWQKKLLERIYSIERTHLWVPTCANSAYTELFVITSEFSGCLKHSLYRIFTLLVLGFNSTTC